MNKDWDVLKNYYVIPDRIEEIDTTRIVLRTRKNIRTPLNAIITTNGNGYHKQDVLFEPTPEYKEV